MKHIRIFNSLEDKNKAVIYRPSLSIIDKNYITSEDIILDDIYQGLKFSSNSGRISMAITLPSNETVNLSYSYDATTWNDITNDTTLSNETIYLKGNNPTGLSKSATQYVNIKITGAACTCEGDLMSLIGQTTKFIPNDFCFYKLFSGSSALLDTPEFIADNLTKYCYAYMFENCTALQRIPDFNLDFNQTKEGCFAYMFAGCTKLLEAPELPATELAEKCYEGMFMNCVSIKTAPVLSATLISSNSYTNIFKGCYSINSITLKNNIACDLLPNFNDKANSGNLYIIAYILPSDELLKQFDGWTLYWNDIYMGEIIIPSDNYYVI